MCVRARVRSKEVTGRGEGEDGAEREGEEGRERVPVSKGSCCESGEGEKELVQVHQAISLTVHSLHTHITSHTQKHKHVARHAHTKTHKTSRSHTRTERETAALCGEHGRICD